jgi:hypothetical protein
MAFLLIGSNLTGRLALVLVSPNSKARWDWATKHLQPQFQFPLLAID